MIGVQVWSRSSNTYMEVFRLVLDRSKHPCLESKLRLRRSRLRLRLRDEPPAPDEESPPLRCIRAGDREEMRWQDASGASEALCAMMRE